MTLGKMILKNKKAVSPVIATILLIALTVTAAAIVYFVVVPLLTPKPQLAATSYNFVTATQNQFSMTLENIGGADATITEVQITFQNGSTTNAPVVQGFTQVAVTKGESKTVTITVSPNFVVGETYVFKVIYDGGKSLEITDTK